MSALLPDTQSPATAKLEELFGWGRNACVILIFCGKPQEVAL